METLLAEILLEYAKTMIHIETLPHKTTEEFQLKVEAMRRLTIAEAKSICEAIRSIKQNGRFLAVAPSTN
jgi:hypothetical protein